MVHMGKYFRVLKGDTRSLELIAHVVGLGGADIRRCLQLRKGQPQILHRVGIQRVEGVRFWG